MTRICKLWILKLYVLEKNIPFPIAGDLCSIPLRFELDSNYSETVITRWLQ